MQYFQDGDFDWSRETQGIILGAFFWGYLVTQIPGGWLAERIGGKGVYGYCMLVCAIATLLTPVGAKFSPYMLVFLRIVKGLGQVVILYVYFGLISFCLNSGLLA